MNIYIYIHIHMHMWVCLSITFKSIESCVFPHEYIACKIAMLASANLCGEDRVVCTSVGPQCPSSTAFLPSPHCSGMHAY